LKAAADEVVQYLDHRNINELKPFDEELNPSAENLARHSGTHRGARRR
jgi:6-pyruvoyltetrahydropterin/6-carboxytetrahydropterin synthase